MKLLTKSQHGMMKSYMCTFNHHDKLGGTINEEAEQDTI